MKQSPVNHQSLEQTLFRFEQTWQQQGSAKLENFVPDRESENYLEILAELVRSDMEFRSDSGQPVTAATYFERFPDLGSNANARNEVVFEEYRLCNIRGAAVSHQQMEQRYGVDASDWPLRHNFAAAGPQSSTVPSGRRGLRNSNLDFPSPGDHVGDFEIVGMLGEGAFGKVYLAQQGELESRLVALKFTTRKTEEHRLLARLQHSRIVPIYSVHTFGPLQAICMPLLGIATLRDVLQHLGGHAPTQRTLHSGIELIDTVNRLRARTVADSIENDQHASRFQQRKLPARVDRSSSQPLREFATRFMQQVCQGLGYAHERGIVHGDLKPANLLVDDDGEPVILDFHLANYIGPDTSNLIGGTLPYMAPEHLRGLVSGELQLQPTMDVYAAGVVLHEILVGSIPHEDEGAVFEASSLADAREQPFKPSAEVRSQIGEDLSAIIATCLEPDSTRRFADGFELAAELQRAIDHQPLQQADRGSLAHRIRKWSRRHPVLSSGFSIAVLSTVLLAALTWTLWSTVSHLGRIKAESASASRISRFQEIAPGLATADWRRDSSWYSGIFDRADELIETNKWRSPEELVAASRRISESTKRAEQKAAAELHFWLAETHRKAARIGERELHRERAQHHNLLARKFWPDGASEPLQLQSRKLAQDFADDSSNEMIEIEPAMATPAGDWDANSELMTLHMQDFSNAERQQKLLEIVQRDHNNFLAWLLLANSAAESGDYRQATAWYTVAISLDPDSELPWLNRGLANLEQNQLAAALADLKRADELAPDDVTILLNFALAKGKNGKLAGALELYDRAIELGAMQTRALLNRSRLRKAMGDIKGAAADFKKFMQSVPTDATSWVARGVQHVSSNPEQALSDFQAALKLQPDSIQALNNVAHIYAEKLDQPEKAIECFDQIIELNPFDAAATATRGVLHARRQQEKPALKDAARALQQDQSAETFYRVAGIYAQLGSIDDGHLETAISLVAKAAMQNPLLVQRMAKSDPDIEPIKENPQFQELMRSISRLSKKTGKSAS